MATPNYTKDLFNGWHSILMFGLLGLILALIISFVQPLKYSSTARLLILQDAGSSVDAYTASRSEERIAENLATIVYTSTFFDQVVGSGFSINPDFFPKEDLKRRRLWGKTVNATVSRGSGLLSLTAFHKDIHQAEQIVRAVSFILTERAGDFTSGGTIQVRLVDAPLNSRWPVKPNIFANIASGFFLGALVGVAYVLVQSQRIRRRHQLVHR
jgi:uncharacterized protein involved in exopolysaccharide biosynthesis